MADNVPAWLRSHLERIDTQVEELRREKKVILDLISDWRNRQEATPATQGAPNAAPVARGTIEVREDIRDKARGLRAAEALDVAVQEGSGRFTKKQLADILEETVESDASSPRTVIFNAIRRKAKRGDLYIDADERVHLTKPSTNGTPEGQA